MKKLIEAVSNGNLEEVKNMLNTNVLLLGYKGSKAINTEVNDSGENALYIACSKGFVEIFEALIEAGAVIDYLGPMGITPFMAAVINNQLEILKSFETIESFQDDIGHVREFDGATSIMLAAQLGKKKCLNWLLENLKDKKLVNQKNKLGETALHLSVMHGKEKCTKMLLENGANIYARAKNGDTPCSLALKSENNKIKELFYSYEQENTNKYKVLEKRINTLYRKIKELNEEKQQYIESFDNAGGMDVIFSPSAPPPSPTFGSKLVRSPTPPENPELNLIDFDGITTWHESHMHGGNSKVNL